MLELVVRPDCSWTSGYGEAMAGQDAACPRLERLHTSDGTLALGFGMDGRADWDEGTPRKVKW